jgi:hypothetical protein
VGRWIANGFNHPPSLFPGWEDPQDAARLSAEQAGVPASCATPATSPVMLGAGMVDTGWMNVFARPDAGSRPPRRARDEPAAAIFTGTPAEVASYLVARFPAHQDTAALITAELAHLATAGLPDDSVCFVLDHARKVTVRP